jgi:hypothetical protein
MPDSVILHGREYKQATVEELEALFNPPNKATETSSQTIERWCKLRRVCVNHKVAGGTLTPEQEDDYEFICFKLDDWTSD